MTKPRNSKTSKFSTASSAKDSIASQLQQSLKQPKNLNIQPHPQIEEIETMQDFRKYTGIADIPEIPLVKQIEHLQAEARRREAALKNRDVSNNQRKGHNGNRRTQENSNASGIERSGGMQKVKTASFVPSRYRNSTQKGRQPGMDKNVKLEEQGFDYHDEIDSDASYEEEFIYETDSEAEQPANGPRIKKMRIKRHLKDPSISNRNAGSENSVDNNENDQEEGKMMFAILDYTQLLIPLLSAHIIFDILVRVQYAQDISWENVTEQMEILQRAAYAAPVLLILHLMFDHNKDHRWFRIASFFSAIGIACYLVHISEEYGYYLVMKRAPPLGTLLIWLFFEMHWAFSAVSLVVVTFWMWLHGYSI